VSLLNTILIWYDDTVVNVKYNIWLFCSNKCIEVIYIIINVCDTY